MYQDFWYEAAVINTTLIYAIYILDTVGLCTHLGHGAANFTDVGILTKWQTSKEIVYLMYL